MRSTNRISMSLHADLRLKEEILSEVASLDVPSGRFRPVDGLIAFLEGLGFCRVRPRRTRAMRSISRQPANPSRHNPGVGIMEMSNDSAECGKGHLMKAGIQEREERALPDFLRSSSFASSLPHDSAE
jgi:hypothetical protein